MVSAVLDFNEQLERIGELGVVLLIGGMISGATVRGMRGGLWPDVPGDSPFGRRRKLSGLESRPMAMDLDFLVWYSRRGIHLLPHVRHTTRNT